MVTTIQLDEETAKMLKQVKKQYNANSYDDLIREMLSTRSESLFGFLGKKDMKQIMRGLRDNEKDRL